eukprot:1020553-Pleurochrysis_carterae.AAC.1
MATSVASRLVAARALNESEDLRIDMRAQSRLALAPEDGGGRVTEVRTAPKLSGLQIAPEATAVSVFAALIYTQILASVIAWAPGFHCVSAWPAVNSHAWGLSGIIT